MWASGADDRNNNGMKKKNVWRHLGYTRWYVAHTFWVEGNPVQELVPHAVREAALGVVRYAKAQLDCFGLLLTR